MRGGKDYEMCYNLRVRNFVYENMYEDGFRDFTHEMRRVPFFGD
jgi:hypothetical protein